MILLHAIGGGLGLFATQLAVQAGATVIGTVGTRAKEKRALEYGAALVVNRGDEDFVAAVMAFTRGRGVDKVVDSTGASILDSSFACIRKLGHVVSYGEAEGRRYPISGKGWWRNHSPSRASISAMSISAPTNGVEASMKSWAASPTDG